VAGGKVDLFILHNVAFAFACGSSTAFETLMAEVYVRGNPPKEIKKLPDKMRSRTITRSAPSTLGMDFLSKHDSILHEDFKSKEGYMEIRKD
jgi:hypothetical protein